MHHFQSDIDMYLHSKWEECCYGHVRLPATYIRQYHSDGSLSTITTSDVQVTPQPTNDEQLTAQPTSHAQLTAQPTSHVQLSPQPTSHVQLTAQSMSHAQLFPQPTSHAQLTAKNTSHAQLTAQPTRSAQVTPLSFQTSSDMQTSSHVTTQPHHSQASAFTFRSTLAKTLSQVLPIYSTIKQFDLLRSRVKQAKEMRGSEHISTRTLTQA